MTVDSGQPADAFCSWSGGKDSCLALYRAIKAGYRPQMLLTMMNETGDRSRSHGLSTDVLMRQSSSLGIPLTMRSTSWDGYEQVFVDALAVLTEDGIAHGIFGDIDLEEHREWVTRVCGSAGVSPVLPLWKAGRAELVDEFLKNGFEATIVAVKEGVLDPETLGRRLTADLVQEFSRNGIDPSGEAGEYHTVVTGGPLFSTPLDLVKRGTVQKDGYLFLDVACI